MTEHAANAAYKYTFPIEKAFIGEDGKRRLVGAATGPEVDLESQRVHPALIDKWIGQVNTGQIQVVYDNNHKDADLMTDLGIVEKAWKNESGHMYVQVILDDDNPVAGYIHKAAMKGKQYGMSIYGKATRYVDEIVSNQRVRTITDGVLERIAHTTRPVWTPSFGTVLSKAIDDAAAESATGDTQVSEETKKTETVVEETTEVKKGEADTTADAATVENPAEVKTDETVVEKAVTAETKRDEKTLQKIVQTYQNLGAQLKDAGLIPDEAKGPEQESTETTVQKSEAATENATDVVALSKAVSDLTGIVTALADRVSDGTSVKLIQKSEEADPLADLRAVENPLERLRLGLAVAHGETSTTR